MNHFPGVDFNQLEREPATPESRLPGLRRTAPPSPILSPLAAAGFDGGSHTQQGSW